MANPLNLLSGTGYKDFMILYKKRIVKSYSFLVIDTALAPNNTLRFRKNLLERIKKNHDNC